MSRKFVSDLRQEARRLGLQDLGVTAPARTTHLGFYEAWLSRGLHGEMAYLARPDAVTRRGDLAKTMPEVRSVVVVAHDYFQEDPPGVPGDVSRGVVARYARGEDYHDVLKARLLDLLDWIRLGARRRGLAPEVRGLAYVDTGPILERDLAVRAGLGWLGKNTMLLRPRKGSYCFLGVLLLDLELLPDPPFRADRCGSCRVCLDACPTGALLGRDDSGAPAMDARRCISYLTIELKGAIPRELRQGIGNRIFGCDICQEVCPFTRKFSEVSDEPAYKASSWTGGPSLVELMGLSEEEFATRFSGSPIKRAKRRGFLRNVAVALGNWLALADHRPPEAVEALIAALYDEEPFIRGHAAWALGEVLARVGLSGDGGHVVAEALLGRLAVEEDGWVREELDAVLRG